MQIFVKLCRMIAPAALLALALLLALPIPAGAQDSMGDSVYISIRHYDGINPMDMTEIERITREGFVPSLSGSEGFLGYYVVYSAEDVLVAINLFETREQALASNELAREFVVDSLAPLLPNPPRIVEGIVDIGFVEMLDGMGDDSVSTLHASVRIYDGFHADDLDEFVAIVEDGFLPIMRGAEGFFGYYLMHDGLGALAAVSLFDSEASALASNENASDFVAENLTAYLPNDPLIAGGRVGIAVLAAANEGANLIGDMMMDEEVFASVRIYEGVDPADQDEIARLTREGFLPIIRESDGFVGYYFLTAEDMLATVSLFDSAGQASASNEAAREFITENLAPLLPNAPMIVEGALDVWHLASFNGMMSRDGESRLYASMRHYQNYDLTRRDEAVELVGTLFLPMQQEAEGFFSYFTMDDGVDQVVTLSVYDTEANALAANELAAEFVSEYMTDWISEAPTRINGGLALAAFANLDEGANLVDDSMMDSKVFASIRVYDGVDPADQDEIARLTAAGFLPMMRESDGFVGYYLLPAGDMLASVSLFGSAEQAAASNERARDFVAENLAPLLPNAPMIVEGKVDVCTQLMFDVVDTGDLSMPLHARLVIYDGFDMARLDDAVALVDSVLLPKLRDAGGLFSYYCISDGADKAVALRVMDSAESLQRGSDIAEDFIAEHMDGWLPPDPIQATGQLAVAALGAIDEGANLVKDEPSDSVFASVRVYDGIDPADQDEIVRLTDAGFLPLIRESDGFVGYYFLPAEDMLATISLFDSPEQASASNDAARDFIVENLAPLLPNPPTIFEGPLAMNVVPALGASDDHAAVDELHASIRFYKGFDLTHFAEGNALAAAHLLPTLQELGGLFAQYAFNDGVDTVVGISVFESEEAALAANDAGKAFTTEYLADWAPNPPSGVSGKLAIAALAQINMGENLVGAMME